MLIVIICLLPKCLPSSGQLQKLPKLQIHLAITSEREVTQILQIWTTNVKRHGEFASKVRWALIALIFKQSLEQDTAGKVL